MDRSKSFPRATFLVRVNPKSSVNQCFWDDEAATLLVQISVPPVENQANEAVIKLIAKTIKLAPSRLTIDRGHHSRLKTVSIEGIDSETLQNIFRSLPVKRLD